MISVIQIMLRDYKLEDIELHVCASRNSENINIKSITLVERTNYKNKKNRELKWTDLEDMGCDMKDFWQQLEANV